MVFKSSLLQSGGASGVSSLNSLTGSLGITSTGATIAITTVGSNINLEASGGSSVSFTALTSGTNTTAAMVVGAGASLSVPTQAVGTNTTAAASCQFVQQNQSSFTALNANVGGTANAITISATNPAGYTLLDSNVITFTPPSFNTGAVTLNVLGTGAVAINKVGAIGAVPLLPGDIGGFPLIVQYIQSANIYLALNILIESIETTVSTNQSITFGNLFQAYVATAGCTFTIDASTNLTDYWYIDVFALGGAVTVTPNASDKINGGTAGVGITIPQGVRTRIITDAAGNLYIGMGAATVTTNANLTGDVTSVGNATTLATVNSNVGTFNNVTVTAKGLVTAASNVSYQGTLTLTTTGTSGAATLVGNTLNIPQYAGTTYTFSTGLTNTAGTVTVNTSQNIATLSNLTSNGFVKTSGGAGTLSVDTTAYTPTSTTVNGHALSSNVTVTASDVGLGSVTNDAQTKAAIVPNTAPSAGQHLVGNAGGTAYAPVTMSGSGATITQASTGVVTISAIANASLSNSTISGVALGGTLSALTATNTTLTFSGSYTGAAAQTVGLNLSNANTWAALQTFGTNISIGGVTATGATGTGNNVFSASPTFTGTITAATGTFSGIVTSAVGTSTGNVATIDGTQTLTNKRITQRVLALSANSATPAINTDSYDVVHITAQTAAITSFTSSLTGTPVDGDRLRISITGTAAVALTWGTSFESSTATLPTTTVSTNRLDVGFLWNTESNKWRCAAIC